MDVVERAKLSLKYWPRLTLVSELVAELERTRTDYANAQQELAVYKIEAENNRQHWMECAKEVERLRNAARKPSPANESRLQRWWRLRNG